MESGDFRNSSFVKTNVVNDVSDQAMDILVKSVESYFKRLRLSKKVITLLRHVFFSFFPSLLEALLESTGKTTFNFPQIEGIHVPTVAHVHVHPAENSVYHLSAGSFSGFLVGLAC